MSAKRVSLDEGLVILFIFVCVGRQVLRDMDMMSAFTYTLHVPNLSQTEHVMAVLEETDVFSKPELDQLAKKLRGKK